MRLPVLFTTLFVLLALLVTPTHSGPLGYGVCQAGCSGVVVACYSAAGFVFGTVCVLAAPPAILQCNAAYGTCQMACAATLLAPVP